MAVPFPETIDQWLLEQAPENSVVVSSRARIARNLPNLPFAPRANAEQLQYIAETLTKALGNVPSLTGFQMVELADLSATERTFLRESHLISSELEKGGTGRRVLLNPEMNASLMINEEDHLRLCTLASGFRLREAYARLNAIEQVAESVLELAFSSEFGYLTACPTNTGTGLRLSVMMHLPALALIGQVEDTLGTLGNYGLVVRGAYGEHSENIGDLFQISNEVTLGKSEQDILETLERIVQAIIEREVRAREELAQKAGDKIEDVVCRAVGLLAMARRIDSSEAVALLSRTRLGIGQNWGVRLTHPELSRLFVDIQPAHLQYHGAAAASPEARDSARARLLRSTFKVSDNANNN